MLTIRRKASLSLHDNRHTSGLDQCAGAPDLYSSMQLQRAQLVAAHQVERSRHLLSRF